MYKSIFKTKTTGWVHMAVLALLLAAMWAAPAAAQNDDRIEAALKASETWLDLIDAGQYDQSWRTAADYFQNVVNRQQWDDALNKVRKPLGALDRREVVSTEYKESLPGVPDGQYVVIQYSSSFENKEDAVETVVPMKQEDGSWKVAGYYVK
jgi:hypothetical protein